MCLHKHLKHSSTCMTSVMTGRAYLQNKGWLCECQLGLVNGNSSIYLNEYSTSSMHGRVCVCVCVLTGGIS